MRSGMSPKMSKPKFAKITFFVTKYKVMGDSGPQFCALKSLALTQKAVLAKKYLFTIIAVSCICMRHTLEMNEQMFRS